MHLKCYIDIERSPEEAKVTDKQAKWLSSSESFSVDSQCKCQKFNLQRVISFSVMEMAVGQASDQF